MKLLILGDSDIARWPEAFLPKCSAVKSKIDVQGFSGATLEQVVEKLSSSEIEHKRGDTILVVCAGENDMGNGLDVEDSLVAIDKFLSYSKSFKHSIFLGPKLEPWLNNDPASRKHYVKLNKGFRKRCDGNVSYIDCLLMFCGETAAFPGAELGGRAMADPKYFHSDQLHLSDEGYQLWKQAVEDEVAKLTGL